MYQWNRIHFQMKRLKNGEITEKNRFYIFSDKRKQNRACQTKKRIKVFIG